MKNVLLLVAALALPAAASAADAHENLPAGEAVQTGDSIYLLGGKWETHDGKSISLESFQGRPVLISMFYATCPHACPMLISDLKRVEKAVPEALRKDLQVVLVTFDPDRDTGAKMKALLTAHGVDQSRWTMLRVEPEKVQEMAAVLGIKYRFAKDGQINHSTVITLLDAKGAIVERIEGLRQPEAPLVEKLKSLSD
jgi:protein SCO1/2